MDLQSILMVVIAGLFSFMWWDIKRRDRLSNERLDRKLYKDGQEIYLRPEACAKQQKNSSLLMDAKLEVIHKANHGMCKKLDLLEKIIKDTNKEWTTVFREISVDIGVLKQRANVK